VRPLLFHGGHPARCEGVTETGQQDVREGKRVELIDWQGKEIVLARYDFYTGMKLTGKEQEAAKSVPKMFLYK
jgi:hypothetical protein